MMLFRRNFLLRLVVVLVPALFASSALLAQDSPVKRGRKYKPPPETSKITVQVTKKFNGKPIMNAAVIFYPYDKNDREYGNMEVKTDPEGKATVDVIPTGSKVRVQVIANGFATFAQDYQVEEPTREIAIAMIRPQEQVSSYSDNEGKASSRKAGIQEPIRPKAADMKAPATTTTTPSNTPPARPQQ
ncbi:Ig-like domain-containing protein [Edaphobacter flagellatus]|uniref:Ig-like domain-containing protein n=1 Tax=Edaphobacter flagellatus TaxID=1933044 RepID=UPI0021B231E8|nr:Ig-like domain-containing protein [Edaphobacter flagellatus]